jgi:predicted site-specific integrase-resolvase
VADPGEELLTTAQAAQRLGISRRTLARYAESGKLLPTLVLPSGQYRWAMSDIRAQIRRPRAQQGDDT